MNVLHIVGRKNHGKTTLVAELVAEFTGRGLRVGAIKHTHHRHELDVPGKDSHRHRTAGAAAAAVLSRGLSAVYLPSADAATPAERYAALEPVFADCDLVLVEGDSKTTAPKAEVWRAERGDAPLAVDDAGVLRLITDDASPAPQPTLRRSDLQAIAAWVAETLGV